MASAAGGVRHGCLRFVGRTDFAEGTWAGIELDEPTGKNDGSVAGKKLVSCSLLNNDLIEEVCESSILYLRVLRGR